MREWCKVSAAETPDRTTLARRLEREIVQGEFSGVGDLFHAAGASAPFLLWNPDTRMLQDNLIGRFAAQCDLLCGGPAGGPLPAESFDLADFGAMRDWIMVLMRGPHGGWRYSHVGAGIVRYYGEDRTGMDPTLQDNHVGIFCSSLMGAVAERKQRILSLHQPPRQVFVAMSRCLVVPLLRSGAERTCAGVVILDQPTHELRDGLEILPTPVLILDSETIVRYANKDARQRFDAGNYGPWARSLFDYAGLDLNIDESPEHILRHGIRRESRIRSVQHQQIGHYAASISAIRHHGDAFYVLLLHPDVT